MGISGKIYEGDHVNGIWLRALQDVMGQDKQDGRDQPTRELLHAHFLLHNPRNRYLTVRRINPAFALAEVIWIMDGSDDLEQIAWWNPRMRTWSDDGKTMHGAYGARLRARNMGRPILGVNSEALVTWQHDQLEHAVAAFRNNAARRDVVLQIWNAEYDMPGDEHPNSKDIPCNIVAMPLIRDGKLEWQQIQRSNDIIWGTPYNFIQWTMIQEIMAGWLGVEVGAYSHLSNSLHVYERHWEHAQEILDNNDADSTWLPNHNDLRLPWQEFWGVQDLLKSAAFGSLPLAKSTGDVMELFDYVDSDSHGGVPEGYRNILRVLAAETLRKLGKNVQAVNMAESITNPSLMVCTKRWLNSKRT